MLGIGDDAAAYVPTRTHLQLVTCDALVESVHWDFDWCTPRELGSKTAAVNLSDLAAMGGIPERAYLVLALPRAMRERSVHAFLDGITKTLALHGARLAGGDTVSSPGPMMVSLTLQGSVLKKEMLVRSGARPGDAILVTGYLGGAAAGLAWVRGRRPSGSAPREIMRRLNAPIPRLAAGRCLARSGRVHAALDLSDGLGTDLRRLAEASRVGAEVWTRALPVSTATRLAAAKLHLDPVRLAVAGGEDYELLFTCAEPDAPGLIRRLRTEAQTPCAVIGRILEQRAGVYLEEDAGKKISMPKGWEHNSSPARS